MKHLNKYLSSVSITIATFLLSTCQNVTNEADPVIDKISTEQYAVSTKGMVSTSHPLATAAGLKILESGGNAVDAAVAAAFTLTVVEPAMSGLGGRLQAIVRSVDGELYGVDATTQAPASYDPKTAPQAKYGYAVVGVPGLVAGLTKLNKEHGSLPLATVMASAIKYAEEGFKQLPGQVELQNMVRTNILEFEGSRSSFIKPNDTLLYGPDDLLVQRDLAATLRAIAKSGADVFYKGEIAKKMVADIQQHGGAVTLESLASYEAKDAIVLGGSYRGHDVYGLWMPSFGAITIEILQILENLPMNEYAEGEWASAMYQAIKIAYEDRFKQISRDDGTYLIEVSKGLIDKEYAKQQAQRINVGQPMGTSMVNNMAGYLAYSNKMGHTTHLSVADKNGMVISLTQSLGPLMGSKVVTPGLGFLYAATLGGYLGPMQPGQRAASHISPMILTTNGEPFMVIGAAGGAKINSAIVQAISRVVDRDMNLLAALESPRVHPNKEGILIEVPDSLAWNEEDFKYLRDNGFILEEKNRPFMFGRVHVVMQQNNKWYGAADPDGEGAAAGPKDR
jgi:gamma-glutamyltranspeptidase / glutathione hydrolase